MDIYDIALSKDDLDEEYLLKMSKVSGETIKEIFEEEIKEVQNEELLSKLLRDIINCKELSKNEDDISKVLGQYINKYLEYYLIKERR